MSIKSLRFVEYWIECDNCGYSETIHTSDSGGRLTKTRKQVRSKQDAIACADFHNTKDGLLCPECFERRRKA